MPKKKTTKKKQTPAELQKRLDTRFDESVYNGLRIVDTGFRPVGNNAMTQNAEYAFRAIAEKQYPDEQFDYNFYTKPNKRLAAAYTRAEAKVR